MFPVTVNPVRLAIIFTLCCCSVGVGIAMNSQANHTAGVLGVDGVVVDYKPQKAAFTLHEPVIVSFLVHNGLSEPITLTLGAQKRQFFQFSLTTPEGQVFESAPLSAVSIVTVGSDSPTIEAGSDYQQSLLLNQWFHFNTAGLYVLTARLSTSVDIAGNTSFAPMSRTIQLRIEPRNPARLTVVCAELAKQVATAPNADAAHEPARDLSFVDDEVAVPFLAQVLRSRKLVHHLVIPALERIGTDTAVEVLLSTLDSRFSDEDELARNALARMQPRISDLRLRETVRKAVELSAERARAEFIKTQLGNLSHLDPNFRSAAIESLMQMDRNDGLQQAEPALQRLARDPNQPTKVAALARAALRKLHPPE